jgi:hypothetical protein
MISIRTDHFDALLDSTLIHLTYMFEGKKSSKEEEVAYKAPEKSMLKLEEEVTKEKDTQNHKTIVESETYEEQKPFNNDMKSHNLKDKSTNSSIDSSDKQDWEKVLFDLRRAKFGKMVLGALLRNVEVPKKIADKLVLKFKSKSLHDHFKSEWQLDLAREAVKKAVTEVYGDGIKLVLEEPDEEQSTSTRSNLLESDIVKSALAMGAKVEKQKEG